MNFTIPDKLLDVQIKGMDSFLLGASARQLDFILDVYSETDGTPNGSGLIVYSAKEREIDLLQMLCVLHGKRASSYTRTRDEHGFSDKPQHQLTVTDNPLIWCNPKHVSVDIDSKPVVWCIKNRNKNFFSRRGGRVMLTGNSHGSLADDPNALRLDVGVDAGWNYAPVSFEEIRERMSQKTWKAIDHHGERDL